MLGAAAKARRLCVIPLVLSVIGCTQSGQDGSGDAASNAAPSGDTPASLDSVGADASVQSGGVGSTAGASPSPAARGAAIAFEGRFDTVSNPNAPTMGWAGSRIRLGFNGTTLSVKLNAQLGDDPPADASLSDTYLAVSIDQNAVAVTQLKSGTSVYTVASGLPRGQHEVVLTKRTEGEFGTAQLLGASTDGTLTSTTPAPRRRIEVIGDSGATGWGAAGVLGDANACATSSGAQDATVSFPLVAAQLLNAQVHNTSYAGKGLVQNRDVANDSYKTLPRLWTRRLPNSPFPASGATDMGAWDPNSWVPDALVLVTSGNDFYANGGPSQASFEDTVSAFIKTLRQTYVASHVYLMVSPMLHNVTYANGGYTPTARTDAIAWCKNVIGQLADGHTHFLDIAEDNGDLKLSCDYHMTPATHLLVAKKIAASIAADLGWSNE